MFCDKNQCLESQVLCKCQRLFLISSTLPLRSQIPVSPQILPECFKIHPSWDSTCGRQVPGLEALQRADIVTLCLDVPDCVGAVTDHAMDHGENSHRQECLGVSSGQLTQHHDHQTPHCPAWKGDSRRPLSWPHFSR